MTEPGKAERHAKRMERKKAVVDESIAAAQQERGVLVVNTGNGKGQSPAKASPGKFRISNVTWLPPRRPGRWPAAT
jgi:hypothetical protein